MGDRLPGLRVGDPRAVRLPRGQRAAAKGPAQRALRAGGPGLPRRPARQRVARASPGDGPGAGAVRHGRVAGGGGRRAAATAGRPSRALLLRAHNRLRAAALGPHRPPAAGAAHGRGGLRDGCQPRLLRRTVARATQAAGRDAARPGRRACGGANGLTDAEGPPAITTLLAMSASEASAGGGFGGLYAARRLERKLPRESARITLVSDENFLLYTPLLPGAAAGSLEPV